MEYCTHGNLRQYLLTHGNKYKVNNTMVGTWQENVNSIAVIDDSYIHSSQMLIVWAWQVILLRFTASVTISFKYANEFI